MSIETLLAEHKELVHRVRILRQYSNTNRWNYYSDHGRYFELLPTRSDFSTPTVKAVHSVMQEAVHDATLIMEARIAEINEKIDAINVLLGGE